MRLRCLTLLTFFWFTGSLAQAASVDTVHIQMGGEPSSLDPEHVLDQYGFIILRNVLLGLFRLNREGHIENGLISSYEISKDGLAYRFRLKKDARWSDGKPVAIDDFVCGLRHALDPKVASSMADYFFSIKNARAVFKGEMPLEKLGVMQDGGDLVIKLEKPDPSLPLELTLPSAAPMRRDVLEATHGVWNFHSPTTGDYYIKSYRVADQVELAPNPFHSVEGQLPVLFHFLSEEVTAMNLLEAERMDIVSTVTLSEIDRLEKEKLLRVFPSTTVFYLAFNLSKPPFDDLTWRRAIASVVDRAGLAKVLHGAFESDMNLIPKPLDPDLAQTPISDVEAVEKIKALTKKPRVRIAYGSSEFTRIVAEKIQNDFAKKLNLQVELMPMDLKTLLGRLKSDPTEMYFLGESAFYDDPISHLNVFASSSGENFSRYVSPAYEKMLENIKQLPFGAVRTDLVRLANNLVVQKDVVIVPVLLRMQIFGVKKSLKNFSVNPYQVIQLNELRK